MLGFFDRLKRRSPGKPAPQDWSHNWTPRDWADLPTRHRRPDADKS